MVVRRTAQKDPELTYTQILEDEVTHKPREELKLRWWKYLRLTSKFEADKKQYGITTETMESDTIILGRKVGYK